MLVLVTATLSNVDFLSIVSKVYHDLFENILTGLAGDRVAEYCCVVKLKGLGAVMVGSSSFSDESSTSLTTVCGVKEASAGVDSENVGEIRSVRPVFIEVLAVSGGEADRRSNEPERRDLTGDWLYACLMRRPDSAN